MLPTKKVQTGPATLEYKADQPLFMSNAIVGSKIAPSFSIKSDSEISANLLFNPLLMKLPVQNLGTTKDMMAPTLGLDMITAPQLMLSTVAFQGIP